MRQTRTQNDAPHTGLRCYPTCARRMPRAGAVLLPDRVGAHRVRFEDRACEVGRKAPSSLKVALVCAKGHAETAASTPDARLQSLHRRPGPKKSSFRKCVSQ